MPAVVNIAITLAYRVSGILHSTVTVQVTAYNQMWGKNTMIRIF